MDAGVLQGIILARDTPKTLHQKANELLQSWTGTASAELAVMLMMSTWLIPTHRVTVGYNLLHIASSILAAYHFVGTGEDQVQPLAIERQTPLQETPAI
ncbi:uncharacterized protein L3040_007834 [Drepanopeziza brunnea f. sp. 'multigermtubi']|uniref:uncharacterized protein n=1 Tax=Drepanopeziza brunnea f. sp. 'multigermtubi' TaxID=698441 RepID=UPI00239AC9B0|nr:hypothetical protein L3040_007834 [Drepanopeziza brunnea f. sp. 'multigermtubi']